MRRAEGTVPRHRDVMGCGRERIERRTGRREEERDCWTRVLRRSAGWRRTAEETPEIRPEKKWNVGWVLRGEALDMVGGVEVEVVGLGGCQLFGAGAAILELGEGPSSEDG